MKKVVVSSPIPGDEIQKLVSKGLRVVVLGESKTREEFLQALDDDVVGLIALLSDEISEEVLSLAPNLKGIANYAVGYNNIDLESCNKRNIPVSNTPDVLTCATADLTWTLILMCMRRIPESVEFLREGRFEGWKPNLLLGRDLHGKTLGIIGMGRIGQSVSARAAAFGMKTVYYTASGVKPGSPGKYLEFSQILSEADVLSLHVPLTPETKHLLGEEELRKMKPEAVLINTSRGPVVSENALVKVLKSGHLLAAGLDVFEKEPEIHPGLFEIPNVVLLPHIGSGTLETRTAMSALAVESLIEFLEGRLPLNTVNPACRNR